MGAFSLLVCTICAPNPGGTQMAFRTVLAKCCHKDASKEAGRNWLGSCPLGPGAGIKNPISIDYLTNDRDQDRATTNSKTCVLNERARIS